MISVTGSNGFIGTNLIKELSCCNEDVSLIVDKDKNELIDKFHQYPVGRFNASTDFYNSLVNSNTVIHLAGLAHTGKSDRFDEINHLVTKKLAEDAVKAGVKNFIYISSIGVLGDKAKEPFTESSKPNPLNDYALSKLNAEQSIIEICKRSCMNYVIIRPPLVYGKGAPGNFGKLLKLINNKTILPFKGLNAKRTLCSIDNLIDFIMKCINQPEAANQIFLVSDKQDVKTSDLIKKLTEYSGNNNYLLNVSERILVTLAVLAGKKSSIEKLVNPLLIDSSFAREKLAWEPPLSADEGLKKIFI